MVTSFDLDPNTFDHAAHLHLTWSCLCDLPVARALETMSRGLAEFAAKQGHPDRYHETITWAFVLIVHDRMSRHPVTTFEAFRASNEDLFDRGAEVLGRYYDSEVLASAHARSTFVWPQDRFSTI